MNIVRHHMRGVPRSVRTWLTIAFACLAAAGVAVDYYRFCTLHGVSANIFEGFLLGSGYRLSSLFHPINACFLICNAPFFDGNAAYIIFRSGRKRWYWQSALFVVIMTLAYYLVVMLSAALVMVPVAYLDNVWSDAMYMLSSPEMAWSYTLNNGIRYSMGVLEHCSPLSAAAMQCVLMSAYTLVLVMLFYMLSYGGRRLLAFAVPVILHGMMFIVYLDGVLAEYSLFTYINIQQWTFTEDAYRLYFFACVAGLSLISLAIGSRRAARTDINNLSSVWLS